MYGIGITTKDRPELLKALVDSIHKHTDMSNVLLHIEDDSIERLGVAKRKNNCLRALKDCDYVFLFDDDCHPIKDGWIEFFTNSKYNHLLYLNKSHRPSMKLTGGVGCNAITYSDCGGVFMFLTKKCIEQIGAFDERFEFYGFEHANYSNRIWLNDLIVAPYIMLEGTEEYLYAHDYSTPNHKSSITDAEKKVHVRNNWDRFFKEPIKDIYIAL